MKLGIGAILGLAASMVGSNPGLTAPPPPAERVRGGGPTNHNPEGPATAGACYRKDGIGWRKTVHSLYYRDVDGQIHAYQPGENEAQDKAFPGVARKRGLVQVGRAERRALHRAERARYRAIVKARGK